MWKSIKTAPKDGTPILVWDNEGIALVEWRKFRYHYPGCRSSYAWCLPQSDQDEQGGCATVDSPTHWMPLPKPPKHKG